MIMPAQIVRIEHAGMPKKSAHFLQFLPIFSHFSQFAQNELTPLL